MKWDLLTAVDEINNQIRQQYNWTPWKQRFAWLPKTITVHKETQGDLQLTRLLYTKRIWLRTYWERKRMVLYYADRNTDGWEYDHALTVLDMLRK